jgi:hypothetical protein
MDLSEWLIRVNRIPKGSQTPGSLGAQRHHRSANTPRPKSLLRCHCTDLLRKIAKATFALPPTNRKAGSRLQDQAGALFFESHSEGALRWLRKSRCPCHKVNMPTPVVNRTKGPIAANMKDVGTPGKLHKSLPASRQPGITKQVSATALRHSGAARIPPQHPADIEHLYGNACRDVASRRVKLR